MARINQILKYFICYNNINDNGYVLFWHLKCKHEAALIVIANANLHAPHKNIELRRHLHETILQNCLTVYLFIIFVGVFSG